MRTRPDRPDDDAVRIRVGSPGRRATRCPTVMRIALLLGALAPTGCTMGIAPRSILTPGSVGAGQTTGSPIALPPEITPTPNATPTPGPSPTPTALGGGGPAILYHSGPPEEEEIVWLNTAGGGPHDPAHNPR